MADFELKLVVQGAVAPSRLLECILEVIEAHNLVAGGGVVDADGNAADANSNVLAVNLHVDAGPEGLEGPAAACSEQAVRNDVVARIHALGCSVVA